MPFDIAQVVAVGGSDAGGFLPAMLQRVKAEIDLAGGFRVAVNGHDAAFFAELGVFVRSSPIRQILRRAQDHKQGCEGIPRGRGRLRRLDRGWLSQR
jgi:hypothetical protein